MVELKKIIELVKDNLVPSDREVRSIQSFGNKMRLEVFNIFKDLLDSDEDVFLAGSVARGTFLKGESDIDIFIRFSPRYNINDIKEILFQRLYEHFPKDSVRKRYAEHPYAEILIEDKTLNVVPCFKTRYPNWLSPADRSYYHHMYLKNKIADLREDIVLAKAFLKGVGVYGAEVYVGGFSGYLTELLVYYYGSFEKFLNNIVKWHPPVIIDIEKFFDSKKDILRLFGSPPLIVVDPIDKGRNVAAAVSRKRFASLISATKSFLKSPKKEYFYRFTPSIIVNREKIMELIRQLSIVVIDLKHKPRVEDIHYPQLKSFAKKIVKQLEVNDFKVLKYMSFSDFRERSIIFILVESTLLPKYTISIGPYPYHKGESNFINKNRDKLLWIGLDGRWYAIRDRRFDDAVSLIKWVIETPLIKIPNELYEAIDLYILRERELDQKFRGEYVKWLCTFLEGEEFWRSL